MTMIQTIFTPISDLNRGKAMGVIEDVKKNNCAAYIMKNNVPEAVLMPVKLFNELQDLLLYQMVEERVAKSEADPEYRTYSREEVMKEFNISEKDVKDAEDVELE